MLTVSVSVLDVNTIVFERDNFRCTLLRLPRYVVIFNCEDGSIVWVKEYASIPDAEEAFKDWVFKMCAWNIDALSAEISAETPKLEYYSSMSYVQDAIRESMEGHK